jgi:hypothetical protein
MPSRRIAGAVVCVLLASGMAREAAGQAAVPARYSVWWSAGWHAKVANGAPSPLPRNRMLTMAGIERRFEITSGRLGVVSFAPALLPAVTATNNRRFTQMPCGVRPLDPQTEIVEVESHCFQAFPYTAFGVGVLPLAFRWQTPPERRFGVIADIDGGGVWFSRRVPVRDGTYFNFAARGGIDGLYRVKDGLWLSAGYRHLHLSNGGTGAVNPGLDVPLVALGVAWR